MGFGAPCDALFSLSSLLTLSHSTLHPSLSHLLLVSSHIPLSHTLSGLTSSTGLSPLSPPGQQQGSRTPSQGLLLIKRRKREAITGQ